MEWDIIAKEYKGYRRKPFPEVTEFLQNKGLTLNLGCGNTNKDTIGLDLSLEQLKLSKGKRVQGDAIKLPFKDKSFDNILFVASLHNIRDRESAIKECHRVLKNKGKILISVWARYQKRFFPKNIFTSEFQIPFGKYKRYYHLFTLRELKKLVKPYFKIKKIYRKKNNIFLIGTKSLQ